MTTVLLAGCGGTGVEILKLISSFPYKITLIDKDTIELSNLNRLFPFSERDIGRYKAEVLGEKYKVEYLIQDILTLERVEYDIIIVAVDNLQCRIHLNYIYKLSPRGILIDCGVSKNMIHVFKINEESYCLYCMREMYEIEKSEGVSCTRRVSTQNNSEMKNEDGSNDKIKSTQSINEDEIKESNDKQIIMSTQSEIPSVCYINSICASLVLLILEDKEYNYYIYNSTEGIYFNRMNLERDKHCILCNMNK